MKRSDKWVLGLSLGAVAVLLLGALCYATVENIKTNNANRKRLQAEEKRLADESSKQRREQWKAYLRSPEGKAEMEKKRAANAAEEEARIKAALAKQPAPKPDVPYPMSDREQEDVLAVIVRLTNDADADIVELNCKATEEHLECIVRFESRQKSRLWRIIFGRLNGDIWSVADRDTGELIWSL